MKRLKLLTLISISFILVAQSPITAYAWTMEDHQTLCMDAGSFKKLSKKEQQLLLSCSKRPDELMNIEHTKEYKGVTCLHCNGNYVLTLRFLYTVAYYYNMDESNAIAAAEKEFASLGLILDKEEQDQLRDLKDAINNLTSSCVLKDSNETSTRMKAVKVLGYVMHLCGDIYAHASIIPAQIDCSNYFDETLFTDWSAFKHDVKSLEVHTSKIKYYTKKIPTSKYEDNSRFLVSRFQASEYSTELILSAFVNNEPWDLSFLLPWFSPNGFTERVGKTFVSMKLKNFDTYISRSGYPKNYLSTEYGLKAAEVSTI